MYEYFALELTPGGLCSGRIVPNRTQTRTSQIEQQRPPSDAFPTNRHLDTVYQKVIEGLNSKMIFEKCLFAVHRAWENAIGPPRDRAHAARVEGRKTTRDGSQMGGAQSQRSHTKVSKPRNVRVDHRTPTFQTERWYSGLPMLLINVYWSAKSGQVLVPTMAKTDAGFWLEVDPVEEAAISDVSSITAALQRCASRGCSAVPTPPRSAFPDWVVLKHANKRNLRDFENEYRTAIH